MQSELPKQDGLDLFWSGRREDMKEWDGMANGKWAGVILTSGDYEKEILEIVQAQARGLRWGLGT